MPTISFHASKKQFEELYNTNWDETDFYAKSDFLRHCMKEGLKKLKGET